MRRLSIKGHLGGALQWKLAAGGVVFEEIVLLAVWLCPLLEGEVQPVQQRVVADFLQIDTGDELIAQGRKRELQEMLHGRSLGVVYDEHKRSYRRFVLRSLGQIEDAGRIVVDSR